MTILNFLEKISSSVAQNIWYNSIKRSYEVPKHEESQWVALYKYSHKAKMQPATNALNDNQLVVSAPPPQQPLPLDYMLPFLNINSHKTINNVS